MIHLRIGVRDDIVIAGAAVDHEHVLTLGYALYVTALNRTADRRLVIDRYDVEDEDDVGDLNAAYRCDSHKLARGTMLHELSVNPRQLPGLWFVAGETTSPKATLQQVSAALTCLANVGCGNERLEGRHLDDFGRWLCFSAAWSVVDAVRGSLVGRAPELPRTAADDALWQFHDRVKASDCYRVPSAERQALDRMFDKRRRRAAGREAIAAGAMQRLRESAPRWLF